MGWAGVGVIGQPLENHKREAFVGIIVSPLGYHNVITFGKVRHNSRIES